MISSFADERNTVNLIVSVLNHQIEGGKYVIEH